MHTTLIPAPSHKLIRGPLRTVIPGNRHTRDALINGSAPMITGGGRAYGYRSAIVGGDGADDCAVGAIDAPGVIAAGGSYPGGGVLPSFSLTARARR